VLVLERHQLLRKDLTLPVPRPNSTNEDLISILSDVSTKTSLTRSLAMVAPFSCSARRILDKIGEIVGGRVTSAHRLPSLEIPGKPDIPRSASQNNSVVSGRLDDGPEPLAGLLVVLLTRGRQGVAFRVEWNEIAMSRVVRLALVDGPALVDAGLARLGGRGTDEKPGYSSLPMLGH